MAKGSDFLVGVAVGAIIALLLSPKTGKDNRDMVVHKYEEIRDKVMEMTKKDKEGKFAVT